MKANISAAAEKGEPVVAKAGNTEQFMRHAEITNSEHNPARAHPKIPTRQDELTKYQIADTERPVPAAGEQEEKEAEVKEEGEEGEASGLWCSSV